MNTLKKIVKTAISKVSPRISPFVTVRGAIERLKGYADAGFSVSTVYDIGAHKGKWSESMQKDFPAADFYLFEANPEHESELAEKGFPYHIGLLSSNAAEVKFYTRGGTGDSVYRENSRFYDDEGFEMRQTDRLEDVARRRNLPLPNFMKVDTQGAEIDILKGTGSYLSKVNFILLECPIIAYNVGAPKMHDYIEYMDQIGFLPHLLIEVHEIEKILVQVDILFCRREILGRLPS
jgi:FkbM family methyltransferase